MRKVMVAFRMAGEAGRGKLSGLYRYISEHEPWNLRIIESADEMTPEIVSGILKDNYDGFIISLPNADDSISALAKTDVPTIVMDIHNHPLCERTKNIAFIRNDSKAIAKAAFDHFFEQGRFLSYAYVPAKENERWSSVRGAAFAHAAESHGVVCHPFSGDIDLPSFLKALTPPAAVFAATDIRANEVLQAARIARLSVPHRLAVIGVDDNRLICENAQPRLSSIRPDFEEEGYRAAQELERMMDHAARRRPALTEPTVIRVGIRGITIRESTAVETPAGRLVARALKYIDENATKGIAVDDVVRHVKVSRRLLYLRFAERGGESIRQVIERRRLDAVRRLLSTTRLSTDEIAARCGYANPNVLRNLFRRRFGVSMRDFRSRGSFLSPTERLRACGRSPVRPSTRKQEPAHPAPWRTEAERIPHTPRRR